MEQQAAVASTFPDLINYLVGVMQMIIPIMIAAAVVIYFYHAGVGVYKSDGKEGRQKMKEQLLWGAIILFVMISIWGIVLLLENSLFR
jgi:succinate dehydrogenase/fumarate reductase cytochrome b subunit